MTLHPQISWGVGRKLGVSDAAGPVTKPANSNLHWFALPVQTTAIICRDRDLTYTRVGNTTPTDNFGTTGR